MHNPFDYFDAIYCINLDRRTDRWEAVQREFDKVGIRERVVRFSAIETPENGHIGCMLSHREIIQKAKDMGWKNVLVFEDDISIRSPVNFFWDYIDLSQKYSWDILYFGGSILLFDITCLKSIGKRLFRCKGIRGGFALAYNSTIFDILLEVFKPGIQETKIFLKKHIAFDRYLSLYLQPKKQALTYHQILVSDRASHSDIKNVESDMNRYTFENFYFWKTIHSWKYVSFMLHFFRPFLVIIGKLCMLMRSGQIY